MDDRILDRFMGLEERQRDTMVFHSFQIGSSPG